MRKHICCICGEIYDPDVGDPDHQVEPGTPFEELPSDWVCPTCQTDTSEFEPYEI